MTPTPEQIAAMEARGWAWRERDSHPGLMYFVVTSPKINLIVSVWWDANMGSGWQWSSNHAYATTKARPTPIAAADEAEVWLRGALAGFRFPWLGVKP